MRIPPLVYRLVRLAGATLVVLAAGWAAWRLILHVGALPDARGKIVVSLVQAIALPMAIGVALVVLAKPVGTLLGGLGSRITKLTVFDVGIEVAELREFQPAWVAMDMDFRKISPAFVFDSYSKTLLAQLTEPAPADFVVVDLGGGRQWLTSRLFLFAIMLQRFRKVRAFVFLETRGDLPAVYLGAAFSERVRWRLAARYPWLEAAFSRAYADMVLPPAIDPNLHALAVSETGAIDVELARQTAMRFLELIQVTAPVPPTAPSEWIPLQQPPVQHEHAVWITGALLRELLGNDLQEDRTTFTRLQTAREQVPQIVACDTPLVAVTRADGRFQSLVDRAALLEEVAVSAIAQQNRPA